MENIQLNKEQEVKECDATKFHSIAFACK